MRTEELGIVGVVVLLLAAGVWLAYRDASAWQDYAEAHRCEVVSTRAGRTVHSRGTLNGQPHDATVYEPGETCWSCEPGPRGREVCR